MTIVQGQTSFSKLAMENKFYFKMNFLNAIEKLTVLEIHNSLQPRGTGLLLLVDRGP